ncbi:F-box only protein 5-like [Argonauta hians]
MTQDITDEYFKHHNKKMIRAKKNDYLDIKKSILTSTPIDKSISKYFDDSGYVSTPCNTITPINLNDHLYRETKSIEKSIEQHDCDTILQQQKLDWQEPEEEDVVGKKNFLRRSLDEKSLDTRNISKIFDFDCSNIIGKRIGRQNCDIVSELDQRNISAFLAQLIGYLSPEDVHSMYHVSKRWRNACDKISPVRIKLKQLQERKKLQELQKENLKSRPDINLKRKAVTKSELFLQCGASLMNDQYLQKCPSCQYPAKVYPVADKGVCISCNHQYCSKCLASYHGSAPCFKIGVRWLPTEIVNTKKAKKALKRL